ncbi:hypothetical protein [Pseudoalteromonas ostreae]|uniref:hypothetical protein n=1 Tax=Pseudoalteromonas ostreae TaxID=2774154 RepID=UPI001B35B04C|nr:hypothetical protein [Pseudoalteromonas ostreae]
MIKLLLTSSIILSSFSVFGANLTVEEQRIEKANSAMPQVLTAFSEQIKLFKNNWKSLKSYKQATDLVHDHSSRLWLDAKQRIIASKSYDDRELYWARLLLSKIIRTTKPEFVLTAAEQSTLLTMLEIGSRGRTDLAYSKNTTKKILLTGFDPFLLDRNINQSNPSGVAALLLDGQVITYQGISAEINTVMVPVRYKDFDQGIIEELLAPYYALNNVDMVVTVSMGSKHFDLERFPGKRRSVTAPDNANIVYGGTAKAPLIPSLNDRPLPGNEFVEFSLPVTQMQQAKGAFPINDNHNVITLEKAFAPKMLAVLKDAIAVKGGGGGYLSNEISYRSIRLRDQLNSDIPTGHIHTPRVAQFEPETEAKIVKQIQAMLEQSLVAL